MRLVAAAIALAGCGRIGFDPGSGGSGSPGAPDAPAGSVASTCTSLVFGDTFDGTTTGGSWFPQFTGTSGACSVGVTSGNSDLNFMFSSPSSAGCAGGVIETPAIDLHGTCTVFEIATAPANSADRGLVALGTQSDFIGFEIAKTISVVSRSASVDTELAHMPYDAVNQRFLIVTQAGSQFALGAAATASGPFVMLATSPIGAVGTGGVLLEETVVTGTSPTGDPFAVASVSLAR